MLDGQHNVLEGPQELSREIRMHLAAYDYFPEVGSVIHAHPRWLMVFAAAGRTMKPVLEYTDKFGDVECIPEIRRTRRNWPTTWWRWPSGAATQLASVAMGIILPRHGVAVLARPGQRL